MMYKYYATDSSPIRIYDKCVGYKYKWLELTKDQAKVYKRIVEETYKGLTKFSKGADNSFVYWVKTEWGLVTYLVVKAF